MKKTKLIIALLSACILALAGCGSKAPEVTSNGAYISAYDISSKVETEYEGQKIEYEQVTSYYEYLELFSDNTYLMVQTKTAQNMTTIVKAQGTYTLKSVNEKYDGYTEIVLSNATFVDCETDIYNHMFALSINSDTSNFPHEIAGGAQLSKEEFLTEYGVFGSRFIRNQVTITDVAAQNWIDIEENVKVVE